MPYLIHSKMVEQAPATVHKIYVDSRYATRGHPGNFEFTLSEEVDCQADCVAYVSDVSLPVTWLTVTQGRNDQLFVVEYHPTKFNGTPQSQARVVTLQAGVYNASDLAQVLQDGLNGGTKGVDEVYAVSYLNNRLTVSLPLPARFTIMSPRRDVSIQWHAAVNKWLASQTTIPPVPLPDFKRCANDVFGLWNPDQDLNVLVNTQTSEHVNVLSVHSAFIVIDELGRNQTLAPWGGRASIMKRITIDQPVGGIVNDQHTGLPQDHSPCGGSSFRQLHVKVLDSHGQVIGGLGHLCFSIVFGRDMS